MCDISNVDRFSSELASAANFFREIAFEIEAAPDSIINYTNHQAITSLVSIKSQACLDRVKTYEALGYGDAGVLLACPGASLAGIMLDELGNADQRETFYQFVQSNFATTFLAVTEPSQGSNLNQMSTRLQSVKPNSWYLNGEKWLVGHGATGCIGVVIAKISDGPLGVRAILLLPSVLQHSKDDELQRSVLPMIGLKGARLGRLKFKNIMLTDNDILGSHLSAAERGMMALIKTFNRMRPCVGALAIGVAQAIVDYISTKGNLRHMELKRLNYFNQIISVSRDLLYLAALHVEENPFNSSLSSLAKIKATQTAEMVANAIPELMEKFSLVEHPLLEKWYRDVWGFEYMEGTQNMHKLNIFNSYHAGAAV
jgi:acyl-CoA dehydrogenase